MSKEYKDPLKKKNDHWQIDVSKSVFPKGNDKYPMDAFLARPPSERPSPHVKINECDH